MGLRRKKNHLLGIPFFFSRVIGVAIEILFNNEFHPTSFYGKNKNVYIEQ